MINILTKLDKLREQLKLIANPHFYTGRSVSLLMIKQVLRFLAFLHSEKPAQMSLNPLIGLTNIGRNKTALVLGNGPSLDRINPNSISHPSVDVFVCNGYLNLEISNEVIPSFYFLSDPMDFILKEDGEYRISQELVDYLFNHEIKLVVPHIYFGNLRIPALEILFFDDRERTLFSKNISPLKPRAYSSSTSYKALAAACFMNYEKIYVLGFDNTEFHDYKGNKKNQIVESYKSYARTKKSDPFAYLDTDENGYERHKTNPSPFVSGMSGRMQSYSYLFGDLRLFANYPIINLDSESLSDAFPKVESHPFIKTQI